MSKVTVITNDKGKIISIGHGHLSEKTSRKAKAAGVQAGLRAGPGQTLHELDVPGDLASLATWSELHESVRPHVPGA